MTSEPGAAVGAQGPPQGRRFKLPGAFRFSLDPRLKLLIGVLVVSAFSIQAFRVLLSAYPVMVGGTGPSGNYGLDFGVYYDSAWRLIHNPSQLYNTAQVPGDWPNVVPPTFFKYLPFFSFFMLPFLSLDYTTALLAWNGFQFVLLPIMGLLIYRALRGFNIIAVIGVLWVVLLQPIPFPPHYAITFYGLYHSQSYYWQWAQGQAKVLVTFFIVASYFLSKNKMPLFAGIVYGLAFYDPRIPLYAAPLMLIVNRGQYRRFALAAFAALAAGDAILLYGGLGGSFLNMVLSSGISTPLYQYVWIPIYSIAALTVVEGADFCYHAWLSGRFRGGALGKGTSGVGHSPNSTK